MPDQDSPAPEVVAQRARLADAIARLVMARYRELHPPQPVAPAAPRYTAEELRKRPRYRHGRGANAR